MRKFILGVLGIAGIFLATNVYAAGTATVKFDTATITTLTTTTNTTTTDNITSAAITNGTVSSNFNVQGKFRINGTDTTNAAAFTDNQGSKMDSGALSLTSGSQTVTTSLTAVDRVFYDFDTSGTGSATSFRHSISGAGFTVYGYNPVTGATSTSSHTGNWYAIDE